MKRISISLAALVVSCAFSDSLLATCVDVDVDTHIAGGSDSGKNFGTETSLSVGFDTTVLTELVKSNKTYIRFDISGETVGATPALNLTLAADAPDSNVDHTFFLWGLNDNATDDAWSETSMDWDDAPANDTTDYSDMITSGNPKAYKVSNPNNFHLATFTILGTAKAGDVISIPFTRAFLDDNGSGNDLVTFMITPDDSTTLPFKNHFFAAKDDTVLTGPQLFINAPPAPEPSSLVLCGLAAICFGGYSAARRRFARPRASR